MGKFANFVVCIIALAAVIAFGSWFPQWRYFHRLKRQGRFLKWTDVVTKLQAGSGCLIVNYAGSFPWRIWWVSFVPDEDDVAYVVAVQAYATDCPFRLRTAASLRRMFPMVKVIENHASIW